MRAFLPRATGHRSPPTPCPRTPGTILPNHRSCFVDCTRREETGSDAGRAWPTREKHGKPKCKADLALASGGAAEQSRTTWMHSSTHRCLKQRMRRLSTTLVEYFYQRLECSRTRLFVDYSLFARDAPTSTSRSDVAVELGVHSLGFGTRSLFFPTWKE